MFTSQSLALASGISNFPPAPIAYKFQQSRSYGFYYYHLTKCGCTFTKSLINHLDGRAQIADPIKTTWDGKSGFAFVIVRNPIDRFLSLYFDKILDQKTHIGRSFFKKELINKNARSVEDHQHNIFQALGHISSTIPDKPVNLPNYHWRPQIFRLHKISNLNVKMLTLDGLSWQLPYVLGDICPDISNHMTQVRRRNVSYKPCDPTRLMTQKLRRQISRIYADDERVYCEANRYWAGIGTRLGHHGKDIKQTARGWLVADRQACRDNIQRSC